MYTVLTRSVWSPLIVCLVLLAACTTDDYDKGDGKYSQLTADFVKAYTNTRSQVFSVVTDEGDSLMLSQPISVKWITRPDTVYRAALYHKPGATADPHTTEAVSLSQVLTASPHKKEYFKKGILTDPVKVQSVWVSKNRSYLNVALLLMTGSSDEEVRQTLGFVADTTMTNPNNTRTLHLTLFHDQAGAPEYYSQLVYICVPLAAIKADYVSLTVNTYDGPVIHALQL